ncbi:SWIM zinc finger family protein [Yoonia sp. SDW83-1]|uniref:SWIM zinc finger family protein n=1 Tax=Yoonia sp. SDW83-1 TaxID=3366945 RepID=UPI00398C732D
MSLTTSAIENAAPDQASLKAASKLLSPNKWPERLISGDSRLIWGACQGSGANPYRVVVDLSDLGTKCSCPSRKFPCKHALALMLLYSSAPSDFGPGDVPDWVTEWLGRRRKSAATTTASGEKKSLAAAQADTPERPDDPKTVARSEAAAAKRAAATQKSITDGLAEMEAWIADQLRTGLAELLIDLTGRCRRIASRLVDAKAGSLAGRIDGIPARVLALPQKDRPDALIAELGKLVIIAWAWGNGDNPDPALRRIIAGAENRDVLLEDKNALRHKGRWEVLASRDETRRDGLIARSTWLLGLDQAGPRFALLQDFFPASLGKQGAAFTAGDQFQAELVFYPAPVPLRAQIVERINADEHRDWPAAAADADILRSFSDALGQEPWLTELPVLLPAGRLATAKEAHYWRGSEAVLPLTATGLADQVLGAELRQSVVLWNGHAADLLAADTNMGRFHADA